MALSESNIGSKKQELIEKRSRYLMPCYKSFYRDPVWLVRASMQYVFDEQDRRYVDCFSGVGVVNCGHCNADIHAATMMATFHLDHTTTIYLTEPIIALAERLAAIAPGGLNKSFFCSSGSEANDGAAVLATIATGRRRFIAFDRALHGRTLLTMNLTGLEMWRTDTSLKERTLHLPTPHCYRCPFGKRYPECDLHCASEAIAQIDREVAESFAAMFVEPMLGNGGVVPLPDGYLEILGEALRQRGIVLIVDEMQTGFGRTGRWFGIEHAAVEPDVMTIAKALANGVAVGAFIATEAVASTYTQPGASTFGGNATSMAAAHATLDYLAEHHLPERARDLGAWLMDELAELAERFDCIGDVRGRGLMVGVEIVKRDGSEDPTLTDTLLEGLRERGFLVGKTGTHRNVVTLMPPLVVDRRNLEDLLAAFQECLAARGGA